MRKGAPSGGAPFGKEVTQVTNTHVDPIVQRLVQAGLIDAAPEGPEFTGGTLGAHALEYARAGLEVLPLRAQQKIPLTAHGLKDATADAEQVVAWWRRWPNANIGIRPPAGVVVVDIDPRGGGDTNFAELVGDRGMPETWTAVTGSGGLHIWLRQPGPLRGKLCAGVDLKSRGGYLVVPPSLHPNGATYEWINAAPIAYAPRWLRPMLAPPVRRPAPLTNHGRGDRGSGLVRTVAVAAPGNRNAVLFWAACTAAAEGILPEIRADLAAAAESAGLHAIEVERTIASAERKATP
ncbi:DNA primase [Nocardia cyriacigeorgica]|nr:DNA primase [Nocardia cyriacigeorgica]PPJ07602.1 DNA primase [Nocardia cyriacigeorgica]